MELTLKNVLSSLDLRNMNRDDRFRLELMCNDDDIEVIGTGEFDKFYDFICLSNCVVSFDGDTFVFPALPVGHPYTQAIVNTLTKAQIKDKIVSGIWIMIMDKGTMAEVMSSPETEEVSAGVSVFIFFDSEN